MTGRERFLQFYNTRIASYTGVLRLTVQDSWADVTFLTRVIPFQDSKLMLLVNTAKYVSTPLPLINWNLDLNVRVTRGHFIHRPL